MKVIIAGSRGIGKLTTAWIVKHIIADKNMTVTEVVSGTARGVDQGGELYASRANIPIKRFPADWDSHGKSAGYIRNKQMAEYADALICLWDGESKGAAHMFDLATKAKLVIYRLDISK